MDPENIPVKDLNRDREGEAGEESEAQKDEEDASFTEDTGESLYA